MPWPELPRLLGILNATPDSFYASSRSESLSKAVDAGLAMADAGADAIDIGGESTRPGAESIPVEEEKKRVLPIVKELSGKISIPISIDTQKAEVARSALDTGASWINDVSGFRADPEMIRVAASRAVPVIAMHIGGGGTPRTMQAAPRYDDVVGELLSFFRERLGAFVSAGGREQDFWIDPGIGFGKTLGHNLEILRRLPEFTALGRPIVVGTSRKSFLGRLQAGQREDETDLPMDDIPGPEKRLSGTLATALWAAARGTDWLRVHDVGETRQALKVWEALHATAALPANP